MNTKNLIRAELEKLSKEDLINIIVEGTNAFVVASMNSKIVQDSNLHKCVISNTQIDTQPTINGMMQELEVNFQKMNNNE